MAGEEAGGPAPQCLRFEALARVPRMWGQVVALLSQEWDMSATTADLTHDEPVSDSSAALGALPLVLLGLLPAHGSPRPDSDHATGHARVVVHACLEELSAGEAAEIYAKSPASAPVEEGEGVGGMVSLLVVDRQFRRTGMGRRMLDEVARVAVAQHAMEQLYLKCEAGKRGFYERCGYEFIRHAKEMENGHSLLWMMMKLPR